MNKFLFMICTAFIFSSCEKFPTSWSTEPDLSEDRGILLTSQIHDYEMMLIWSKNTDEIIAAGKFGIKAINISSRAMRTIENANAVYHIKLSEDGNKLYYLLGDGRYGGAESLYKIFLDGKGCQLLLDNLYFTPFMLSSDSLIVHCGTTGDSLYLYNGGSKSNSFLTIGRPLTFSPDGKYLLYSADSSLYTISIENRIVQRMSLPWGIQMIRWDGNGIRIFYRVYDLQSSLLSYYITNVTTNETTKLYELKTYFPYNIYFAWSTDGTRIIFWTSECIKWDFLRCEVLQRTLHLININEKKRTRIAWANNSEEGSIAFSPDGKKIAYVLGTYIYTKDIP